MTKTWPAALDVPVEPEGAVVMVGHSDCETSRLMLRTLERLHQRRTRPLAVAAVLQDEPEAARALAEELDLTLPWRLDRDPYPLTAPLGLTGVPVTFRLGPDRSVREQIEAFRRADVERLAELAGVQGPLFAPEETVPALRPG
jgi:hypothetical protein